MVGNPVQDRRLWSSLGKALGAEIREKTSVEGASGLVHPLQALCVDDKGGRVILFSDEPNPRVAALIQGDVQATLSSAKVIVARPTVVDLGALVRGVYDSASDAYLSLPKFSKYAERFGKLSQKKKDKLLKQPNLAVIGSMATAFKNVPMPVLSYIGAVIQQAAHIDWIQVFEALKQDGTQISLTKLYEYDGSAIDREFGVCPIPLYQLTENDWELFLRGNRTEDIQQRLKDLNIFQYFFPAPDQLALGAAERGITNREEIIQIIKSAPSQGHPLGEMELVPTTSSIQNLVTTLQERQFVSEVDHSVKVTADGTTARLKIKSTPREGVVSKLVNRIKLELKMNIRASTKDFGSGT